MKHSFRNFFIISILVFSIFILSQNANVIASSHDNIEVTTDTVVDGQTLSYTNQSIIINNTATYTITNSYLNFSNYDDTGIQVANGSLIIEDSTIASGDKCITGYNSGNVTIINSTIIGCLGDGIELEGDYNLSIISSNFLDMGSRGIDILDLPSTVELSGSYFNNTGSDAIRFENTNLSVNTTIFHNIGDDSFDSRGTGDLVVKGVTMNNIAGDGLNLDDSGSLLMENTIIQNVVDDGIQSDGTTSIELNAITLTFVGGDGMVIEGEATISLTDVTIQTSGDEGIQITFATSVDMEDVTVTTPDSDGIDLSFITGSVSINNTLVDGSSSDDGIQISDTSATISITNSQFSNSEENGIEFTNVTSSSLSNVIANDNTLSGIEIWDGGTHTITGSSVSFNEIGIYANNTSSLTVTDTDITNNALGVLLGYSGDISITQSDLSNNAVHVNATLMPSSSTVDMTNNYWGTTALDAIIIYGDVDISPILDADGNQVTDEPTTSTTTTLSETESDASGLNFHFGMIIVFIGMTTYLKRKQKL